MEERKLKKERREGRERKQISIKREKLILEVRDACESDGVSLLRRGRSDVLTRHQLRIYEHVVRQAELLRVGPGKGGCF